MEIGVDGVDNFVAAGREVELEHVESACDVVEVLGHVAVRIMIEALRLNRQLHKLSLHLQSFFHRIVFENVLVGLH